MEQWLKSNCVGTIPKVLYIPDYVSAEDEQRLIESIRSTPENKWTHLRRRRLINLGGTPHPKGMMPQPLPSYLQKICQDLVHDQVFPSPPNHVLINEYPPGVGIMPHEDGPLYHPVVAILSLGSHCGLDFYTKEKQADDSKDGSTTSEEKQPLDQRHLFTILTQPRSLLIFSEDAYKTHLHGIKDQEHDILDHEAVANKAFFPADSPSSIQRNLRYSLTIRIVPKTINANLLRFR
eukprot:TRINITY_DN7124_c0_g1_i1.p1 TRINITY_DN7124_c0_g1~~TRINITY_DN7124_c0_g1_i1.p1  ORF type:complete len:235 (-),score=50.06 TRINITY_DN7124_c0_g1_i1:402-1106(-)